MIINDQKNLSGSHLFGAFWKTFRSIERYDRQSIEKLGLGCLTDFAVLDALREEGALSVSGLGARVLLTSGSITTAVDRLHRRGWVRKEKNPHDGRGVVVALTPDGHQIIRSAFTQHAENFERLFGILEETERQQFSELLSKVSQQAETLS